MEGFLRLQRHRSDVAALDRRAAVEQRGGAVVVANRQAQFQGHSRSPKMHQRCSAGCFRTIPRLQFAALTGPCGVAIVVCHKSFIASSRAEAYPMKLPPFEYACPTSLDEAVALLAAHGGEAKALAGGQSLMPMMAFRVAQPSLLVDLRKLPGLKEIRIGADGVRLGALVRWRDILDDKRLATAHPLLEGGGIARRALPDQEPRHGRRQPRPRRSGLRDARHRSGLRGRNLGDRQGRSPHHQGQGLSAGRADHGAEPRTRSSPRCICRHGRPSDAGASRSSRAAAAISPWPASRSTTTKTAARPAMPISACSASAIALIACTKAEAALNGKAVDEALCVAGRRSRCRRGRSAGGYPRQRGLSPRAHRHAHRARAESGGGEVGLFHECGS